MRSKERRQWAMLVVFDTEQRLPKEHPLRRIKPLAYAAMNELSPLFASDILRGTKAVDSTRFFH